MGPFFILHSIFAVYPGISSGTTFSVKQTMESSGGEKGGGTVRSKFSYLQSENL